MSHVLKQIDIKSLTCHFFDDMNNIKYLVPNKIKIDEKSYKNILIYRIGYMTVKDLSYTIVNSVVRFIRYSLLYVILNKINGYIKESKEINIWR